MALQTYLYFRGNCAEALQFYTKVFHTETPRILRFGDMPANIEFPISDETKKLVLHSELDVFGGKIMFSDVPENLPYNVGNNVSIVITTNNMDEARSTFERLSEGGLVTMDLQETFWSKLYGMVTDQFGVNWQISHAA